MIKIWINQFCKKRKKGVKCYYSCLILDDTAITSIKNIKDVKCGTYFFEGGSEGLCCHGWEYKVGGEVNNEEAFL